MPFRDDPARRDYQRKWRRKQRAAKHDDRESASRAAEPTEPELAPSA